MGPKSPICAYPHGSVLYPMKLQNTTLLVVLWANKHFTSYVFFLVYLENQSSTREKIAQLQHIQFLIEQQPIHRRELITKLTRHLVR